jgi:ParB family transcriptional regulator, chromosome partitioning protein
MKRKALGKGLSALLPDPDPAPGSPNEAAVSDLEPNPHQPRTGMDPARLQELADSIRESGMVQPILVRPHGSGYQIIAGERRWRAAQKAGLERVPITVREVADRELLELALVENIQRQELSALEEAVAYQRLQEELGLSQDQVAKKVGRDRATVSNTVRLLRSPKEVKELLAAGRIDAGHARALLALDHSDDQVVLAREAARKHLSVREVERRVAQLRAPRKAIARKDANTRAAEERLRNALGTRVQIARRGKGGALRIAFTSEGELNRLYEILVRAARGR